jgi:aspartate aminotransferase
MATSLASTASARLLPRTSAIRKAFELGRTLKERFGAENVFDFSLGNPALEPPTAVQEALEREVGAAQDGTEPLRHGYTPNWGLPKTREALAGHCRDLHPAGLGTAAGRCEMTGDCIVVTPGAAAALSIFMRTVCDPGEEVAVLRPFFCEYASYAFAAGLRLVEIPCDHSFDPDLQALEAALGPDTRLVIVNSPNNPSGRVYSQQVVDGIAAALCRANSRNAAASGGTAKPVWLLSDEPYAKITFPAMGAPPGTRSPAMADVFQAYPYTAVATSFSKDLSLPGERIGYLAVSPLCSGILNNPSAALASPVFREVVAAATMWMRVLGFISAPVLMQRIIPACLKASVDVSWYDERRRALCQGLREAGLEIVEPQGALYVLLRAPYGMSGLEFHLALAEYKVLCVEAAPFGMPNFVRFCFAVPSVHFINRGMEQLKLCLKSLSQK